MHFSESVLLTLPRIKGSGVIEIRNELTAEHPFLGWVLVGESGDVIYDSALHGNRCKAEYLREAIKAANSYDEHLLCEEYSDFLTEEEKNELLACCGVLTDEQEAVLKSDVAQALLSFRSTTL